MSASPCEETALPSQAWGISGINLGKITPPLKQNGLQFNCSKLEKLNSQVLRNLSLIL